MHSSNVQSKKTLFKVPIQIELDKGKNSSSRNRDLGRTSTKSTQVSRGAKFTFSPKCGDVFDAKTTRSYTKKFTFPIGEESKSSAYKGLWKEMNDIENVYDDYHNTAKEIVSVISSKITQIKTSKGTRLAKKKLLVESLITAREEARRAKEKEESLWKELEKHRTEEKEIKKDIAGVEESIIVRKHEIKSKETESKILLQSLQNGIEHLQQEKNQAEVILLKQKVQSKQELKELAAVKAKLEIVIKRTDQKVKELTEELLVVKIKEENRVSQSRSLHREINSIFKGIKSNE